MSLNWNEDDMEFMKEDCLDFIRMVFIDLYYHRILKICNIILLMVHVPLAIVQYYYFFKSIDTTLLFQYGPTSLVMIYVFLSMMILFSQERYIKDILAELTHRNWSIITGSQMTQQKLKKVTSYATNYAKLSLFLGLITYILVVQRQRENKEWEIFYQVTFFKDHFPNQANALIAIFYISVFLFILPMMAPFYILAYVTLHLYFQSVLVLERIENITDNSTRDIRLVDDDQYQRQIFHRLRFCVKRYIDLKQFACDCIEKYPEVMVAYMTLSFVLVFSYLSAWYLDPDKYYPLIFMLSLVSFQVSLIVAESGQLTEGESERLYEVLVALPWYTFNAKNQKILLIFIGQCSHKIAICPYESFPVNRRLAVQYYKVFSSVSALLASTRHDDQ